MTSEVTRFNSGAMAQQQPAAPMPKIMEDVLLAGDLAKLTPDQRVSFYGSLCQSLGLNPLTKPFDYLNLGGKLVLYAGKACAEQLRYQHGVTTRLTSREVINDIYVVTAKAVLPSGREDESTGAVSIKGVSGEALAIAYMKAETKAKRRVTLSICGLGMMDESEVDSIRGAQRVRVDMSTGSIDTGGHPTGTQAAADYVAQQKIANGRGRQSDEDTRESHDLHEDDMRHVSSGREPQKQSAPAEASRDFKMLEEFSKMKRAIGDKAYYIFLGNNGFEKSSHITDKAVAKRIWKEMDNYRLSIANRPPQSPEPEPDAQPAAAMADQAGDVWEAGRE